MFRGNARNASSVDAADNSAGLSLVTDTEGRNLFEGFVTVSSTATVNVYGSNDNSTFRQTHTYSVASTKHLYYFNAFRYVKIEVTTTGIDVAIEATAS